MALRRMSEPMFYGGRRDGAPGPTRIDVRKVAFFATMVAFVGMVGWLYLFQTSQVASCAREIRDLEQARESLHQELVVLRAEVAELGSLERILTVGESLGYSLPDAADVSRRLSMAYESPLPQVAETTSEQIGMGPGQAPDQPQAKEGGLFQRLLDDLKAWVASPPPGE